MLYSVFYGNICDKSLNRMKNTNSTTITTEVDESMVINTEKNYFGIMGLTMVIGSCWGGIVAMFVLEANAPAYIIFINVLASLLNNVAAIAQLPYKTLLLVFYGTCLVNGLILLGLLIS